jgi:chromosome segregation protein
MLEEALGLRVYQIKKNEALRKLEATDANIRQVEGLLGEIAPHLKFLRAQARRMETREELAADLRAAHGAYFAREDRQIAAGEAALSAARSPLDAARRDLQGEIAAALREIADAEARTREDKADAGMPDRLHALQERRRTCERELGRLEGARDAAVSVPAQRSDTRVFRAGDAHRLYRDIRQFLDVVRGLAGEEDVGAAALRGRLMALVRDMERSLEYLAPDAAVQTSHLTPDLSGEFDRKIAALREDLAALGEEIGGMEEADRAARASARAAYEAIRGRENNLRTLRERERDTALALERLRFDEERLDQRREIFLRERRESGFEHEPLPSADDFSGLSQDDLRRRIERLRLKLEEIGGIDESVKKEYAETEARHDFLHKESADLTGASASLKTLIGELDARMKTDFQTGFRAIQKEFHEYFKIIFGGGSGRLVVVRHEAADGDGDEPAAGADAENARDEGIDIEVDLPRKRIKGLAMLSGGERALTAIALLFAIAAVNPPPFLVLDETDAALDEANSRRWSSLLVQLSRKTQLIVITHNRETMQCAGVLYGVTMGEDGVSRLLSLKLEDADAYASR